MKHINRQVGFTAVELLITLFIAAVFLLSGLQLYASIIKTSGETRFQTNANNVIYDYMQRYKSTTTNPCTVQTPLTNQTITVAGLSDVTISVAISCPYSLTTSVSKILVTMSYNDPQQTVNNATYINLPGIVIDGLVLNLDAGITTSYPGTGTVWYDLSGNGNDGVLNGGVTYSTANGGVMGFDGVDDYVRVANKLSGTVGTVCFFIKDNSPGLWTDIFTIDTGVDSTSSRVENTGNGNYRWYGSSGGFTSGSQIFSHYGLQWDYISLVFDGTAARSYKNGTLSYQGPISDSFPVATYINIGRRNSSGNWRGSISSFNIYDRALTVGEILQNFNALRGRYGV